MISSVATGPNVGPGMAGRRELRAAQQDAALGGLVELDDTNLLWAAFFQRWARLMPLWAKTSMTGRPR